MLSDEEKQAIKVLNHFNPVDCGREDTQAIETILNLIEKQSKEIEHQKEKRENQKKELAILNAKQIEFNKLVNTVNSYKGQFKRQQKEIEELKEQCKEVVCVPEGTCFMLEAKDIDKKWKDKIKAKIEESELLIDNSQGCMSNEDLYKEYGKIEFGQSLLEKE